MIYAGNYRERKKISLSWETIGKEKNFPIVSHAGNDRESFRLVLMGNIWEVGNIWETPDFYPFFIRIN